MSGAGDELWESHAAWWQDGFTEGADPEYEEQILPLAAAHLAGARRVLDVGCGEGQIARLALRGDAEVAIGVDPTWGQVKVAAERGGGASFTRAGAAALPFASGRFDAAVACLVFEHITDVDAAIGEVARVLAPGGRFLFFLNHPLLQTPNSGWIDDQILDPPEQYWRIGPYLVEDETIEEVEKGVFIPFIHRPCPGTSTRSPTPDWCCTAWRSPPLHQASSPVRQSTRRRPPSPASSSSTARRPDA